MKNVKKYLKKCWRWAKSRLRKLPKMKLPEKTKRAIAWAVAASLFACAAIKAPDWHYSWVRSSVGSKVYFVTNEKQTSGGTGVHVRAASGKTYLLTNSHVCDLGQNGTIWVSNGSSRALPKRIIENSGYTDLCLIEPMEGVAGIKVASSVEIGEVVAAVGHPRLQPTTMTRGEVVAPYKIKVADFEIRGRADMDRCSKPKNSIERYETFFGPIEICVVTIKSYLTTVTVLGGSSGSPVVNFYGHLVGLVFAGDNRSNWAAMVHLSDVKEFLRIY